MAAEIFFLEDFGEICSFCLTVESSLLLQMRSFGGTGGRASPGPSRRVENLKITPQPKPDSRASRVARASSPWSLACLLPTPARPYLVVYPLYYIAPLALIANPQRLGHNMLSTKADLAAAVYALLLRLNELPVLARYLRPRFDPAFQFLERLLDKPIVPPLLLLSLLRRCPQRLTWRKDTRLWKFVKRSYLGAELRSGNILLEERNTGSGLSLFLLPISHDAGQVGIHWHRGANSEWRVLSNKFLYSLTDFLRSYVARICIVHHRVRDSEAVQDSL